MMGQAADQGPFWNHTLLCSVHIEERLGFGRACFLILLCVGDDGIVICILQLHDGHLRALGLGVEMMEVEELAICFVGDLEPRGKVVSSGE